MGTRIERITGLAIQQRLPELKGHKAQVVTWSGHTYFARVTAAEQETLTLVDLNAAWYNRRKHTHRVAVAEIREVVLDQPATW